MQIYFPFTSGVLCSEREGALICSSLYFLLPSCPSISETCSSCISLSDTDWIYSRTIGVRNKVKQTIKFRRYYLGKLISSCPQWCLPQVWEKFRDKRIPVIFLLIRIFWSPLTDVFCLRVTSRTTNGSVFALWPTSWTISQQKRRDLARVGKRGGAVKESV